MATTHRDSGASLILTLGLLAACLPAHAQKQTPTQTQTPKPAQTQAPALQEAAQPEPAPEQTTQFQPMVDVMLTATNNGYIGTTSSDTPKKDLILKTTVGANVNIKGANTQVLGNWRFTSNKYFKDTQPNEIIPSGRLDLHSDLYRKEAGVDAFASSVQRPQTVGGTVNPSSTGNTTTDTRFGLSPFFVRQFDSDSSLLARLSHTWIRSTKNGGNLPDENGTDDAHLLRWERRPTRLGYEVEATFNKAPKFSDTEPGSPSYQTRKKITVSPLYALSSELVVGPIAGRDLNHFKSDSFNGFIRGAQLRWHPSDHTQFSSKVIHSVFGKEWMLEASSKTPWTVFSITSSREANAQANTSTYTPLMPNDLGAVSNESTAGRMQFIGRRDNFSLNAGLNRTTPLKPGSGLRTKAYFFETEAIHKLTPLSNLAGSLRWTRGWTFAAEGPQLTRDFTARLEVNTKLAKDTTARMGLRRQLTHTTTTVAPPPIRSGAESAAYVGFGYSF